MFSFFVSFIVIFFVIFFHSSILFQILQGPPKAGIRAFLNGTNWKLLTYCYQIAGIGDGLNSTYTGPISWNTKPSNWPIGFNEIMLFNLDDDMIEEKDVSKASKENGVVVNVLLEMLKEQALKSVEPMQWVKPYQGVEYACANCTLRQGSDGNPNVFWTPWVKEKEEL